MNSTCGMWHVACMHRARSDLPTPHIKPNVTEHHFLTIKMKFSTAGKRKTNDAHGILICRSAWDKIRLGLVASVQ